MKKLEIFLLILIVLLAFVVRLYKINRPIADWHSWRQADTAAVARNFIKEGYNPFIPTYDDMSKQSNGLDNPNRYRFVEFPIYNSLIAAVWVLTGVSTMWARMVTVVITLMSTVVMYFLVKKFSGRNTAFLASFLFATIPYNVFYSSTILPAPLMVLALLSLYLSFANWMEKEKSIPWAFLSIIFASIAILVWPIALMFMIPVAYLAYDKYGFSAIWKLSLWAFALLSLAPFVAWRIWMTNFPEGIPNWQFLINEGNIRFKGAFFRWLIAERMGKLILTLGGFALFVLGVLSRSQNKEKYFYYSFLASVVLYFTVFASGNVRHDYYQIPAVPVFVIFMALGIRLLIDLPASYINKFFGYLAIIGLLAATYAFGYFEIKGYYWINKPQIVEAGSEADKILPKDATVIAPYGGDAAFLYQTNRRGYPVVDRPLEEFIEKGTKYIVSVDPNDSGIKKLSQSCKVLKETDVYVILEMSKECIGK